MDGNWQNIFLMGMKTHKAHWTGDGFASHFERSLKMKAFRLLLTAIVFVSLFTSCAGPDNEAIADRTFSQIVNAIERQDPTALMSMFAENVQNQESGLTEQANACISLIQGDIVDFSSAAQTGIAVETEVESGQKRTTVESSFCLKTDSQQYYIAIKECTADTMDKGNEGLISIYIIHANDWKEDFVFRANGEWKAGIHIVQ